MTRSADILTVLEQYLNKRSHSAIPKLQWENFKDKKLSVSDKCCETSNSIFLLLKYNALTFRSNETLQVPLWIEI